MRRRGCHGYKVATKRSGERVVGQCYRLGKRGDVVIDANVLNVHLGVGAHTKQVVAIKCDPVKQRPAHALEREGGLIDPATDLLCIT